MDLDLRNIAFPATARHVLQLFVCQIKLSLDLGWGDCFPSTIIAFDQTFALDLGWRTTFHLRLSPSMNIAHLHVPCFYMPLLDLIVTQTQHFTPLFLPIDAIIQLIWLISALDNANYYIHSFDVGKWDFFFQHLTSSGIDLRRATPNGSLPILLLSNSHRLLPLNFAAHPPFLLRSGHLPGRMELRCCFASLFTNLNYFIWICKNPDPFFCNITAIATNFINYIHLFWLQRPSSQLLQH